MDGLFYSEITNKGDVPFLIVKTVVSQKDKLMDGNIVQSYVQFFDEKQNKFTNLVCSLTYETQEVPYYETSITCGNELLSDLWVPYDMVKDKEDCGS